MHGNYTNFDNINNKEIRNNLNNSAYSKFRFNNFYIEKKLCNITNNKIIILLGLLFLSSYFLIIDYNYYIGKYVEIDNFAFFNDKFYDKENRLTQKLNQDNYSSFPQNLNDEFIENKETNYSFKLNSIRIYKESPNIYIKKKRKALKHIFADKPHKLLYCFIPKNACSKFKNLFFYILKNFPGKESNKSIHQNEIFIKHLLKNRSRSLNLLKRKDWIKFVVIRDPLERLLSGFLNKCLNYPFWCEGSKITNFTIFLERLIKKSRQNISIHNNHYYPQYLFCDLGQNFDYFNKKIFYDYLTIANDTFNFLEEVNLTKYYYKWGKYHNQTMFEERTGHATFNPKISSQKEKINFYKKYYTKELALKAFKLYEKDYELFNWKLPEWLIQLLFFMP